MERKTAAVIFGGQSSEHEVSCMSAANVIDRINKEKYDLLLIGITLDGHWIKTESVEEIRSGEWRNGKVSAAILPDATKKCAILMDGDKLYTKIIVNNLGIRQADYEPVMSEQLADMDAVTARIEAHFAYPVFIKPSNAGSSKGVSKAENREELEAGLKEAAKHDRKILVEETIIGREIECAVFGGGKEEVKASGVGEILAAADFYDFDAKYYNAESKTVTDPELPGNATEEVRKAAVAIFKAVDGYGLSRVDFFVKEDGEVVFNEINTMPGFTAISMYPMLWEARGVNKEELVDKLMSHALERF